MPDINPSVPVIGQPDSTEEPKVVTALTQLIAAVNDVDSDQIKDGTVALADLATALQQALPSAGNLRMTAKASADDGWLLCDGAAVSRATYAALYAAIGDTYGAGDGTTTFNVPDLRGRSPMGAGTGTDLTARTLGAKLGTETISIADMPAHTHSVGSGGQIAVDDQGSFGDWGIPINSGSVTSPTGGSAADGKIQPVLVVNYQIKT